MRECKYCSVVAGPDSKPLMTVGKSDLTPHGAVVDVLYSGKLLLMDKDMMDDAKAYGMADIKYCPVCGRELQGDL